MIFIEGYAGVFTKDECIIDLIIPLIEKYRGKYTIPPTIVKTPITITEDEVKDILSLGPIGTVILEFDKNLVIVGNTVGEVDKRLGEMFNDGEE